MNPQKVMEKLSNQHKDWFFGVGECKEGIAVRAISSKYYPTGADDHHLALQIAGEPEESMVAITMKISEKQYDGIYIWPVNGTKEIPDDLMTQKLKDLPADITNFQEWE